MAGCKEPIFAEYAYRTAPKDIDFHYIINEVKYVEEYILGQKKLAYDNDIDATISILARYYRHYKGFEKNICEAIIIKFMEERFDEIHGVEGIGFGNRTGYYEEKISHAVSLRRYSDCHGYKAIRDFDGIWITKAEVEAIKKSDCRHELLFAILCFTKMYNETNRREGRKVNNRFYVANNVLRRVSGLKKGTINQVVEEMRDMIDKGYLSMGVNREKLADIIGPKQPMYTCICNMVNDDSENVLFIDNFDTLWLTWRYLTGMGYVKRCQECGRYFEFTSGAQKWCLKCKPRELKKKRKEDPRRLKRRPNWQGKPAKKNS